MLILHSDGAGNAQLYRHGLTGDQLCDEPAYAHGGPSAPLYNYASASSVAYQHAESAFRLYYMPLTQLLQLGEAVPLLHVLLTEPLMLQIA